MTLPANTNLYLARNPTTDEGKVALLAANSTTISLVSDSIFTSGVPLQQNLQENTVLKTNKFSNAKDSTVYNIGHGPLKS